MAFVDQRPTARKAASVGGVVLIHLAIGYAFVNGLAQKFIPRHEPPLILLPPIADPKPPPPIPPEPRHKQQTPPLPVPRDPDLPVPPQTGPISGGDTRPLPPLPSDPLPQQPPTLSRSPQAKGDRTAWVTTEDYPAAAIRAGEEGRVGITVHVAANGRVTSCEVTQSSGFDTLDQAACYFYAKRARFLPALAADGMPVAASRVDWVRWQLPAQ